MPDRERILHKVRAAIGRSAGQAPDPPPPPWREIPEMSREDRVRLLLENFPGDAFFADNPEEARERVRSLIAGKKALVSAAPLLAELGVPDLPDVTRAPSSEAELRAAAADAGIGVTAADYALADPGALAILSTENGEDRLISLLPPIHVAVVRAGAVLTGLEELFSVLPDPAAVSSSLVLIGGPSKTGDIEMTITLGVHGPRDLYLVVV